MSKQFLYILFLTFLFGVINNSAKAQNLVINEVMTSNSAFLPDEDGDYPDWIEIYNPSNTAVNLLNFGLTDTIGQPGKWKFPSINIPANEYLIVFASGKNKAQVPNHLETIITQGDQWSYFVGSTEVTSNWRSIDFDDSAWPKGNSGFGYGDGDDNTIIPKTISCFVRKTFTIDDINAIDDVLLHIDYDDGFVAYLNGVAIAWANIDFNGTPPPYNQGAITYTEPLMSFGELPTHFPIPNWKDLLVSGKNVLSIQVHNSDINSSDITLIPFLTLVMDSEPNNARGPVWFLASKASQLHTNFKISSEGEGLYLFNASNVLIDEVAANIIPANISYGCQPNGSDNYFYFEQPTPNSSNNTTASIGISETPRFSLPAGFYNSSLSLEIKTSNTNDLIRYSTDGSDPTTSSTLYTKAIPINSTTVVRAKAFSTGKISSKILTQTYFINENKELPIVSLATTPSNLFDWNTGIYELGPNAQAENPNWGANFWQDWEKPGNIELFDKNGSLELNAGTGIKIFGAWSRAHAQKSFAFFARKQYGNSSFKDKIFEDKPIDEFESFVMRNGGNDWRMTMFRDGLMTGLTRNMNTDRQAFRQSLLYINGKYWGIQNIREKINENYLADNHKGVDADSVDLLENDGQVLSGSAEHYTLLKQIVGFDNFDYQKVKSMMDVNNYIDYQLTQIYIDNTDWPGNNIKFWRPATETGKWRWILYDTDFGFGIWNSNAYTNNTLAFALATGGTSWPNPDWSTYLLRRMLTNLEFRNQFINRFADMLNSEFLPSRVQADINKYQSAISSEMDDYFNRWGGSVSDWSYHINNMRTFTNNRPANMRNHIQSQFSLPGQALVTLNVYPQNVGKIKINTIQPGNYNWSGTYFKDVPITVIAQAPDGYRFVGWTGNSSSSNDTLVINLSSNISLTANFEEDITATNPVIINEINYNSSTEVNTSDWVELYNTTSEEINISKWVFKDSDNTHSFVIPENTVLPANAYLVLCSNKFNFDTYFPNITNRIGDFDFGLSSTGELIRLYDARGKLRDSVPYGITAPWPMMANGNGPTLELIRAWYDNSQGETWEANSIYGTPGKPNSSITEIKEIETQNTLVGNYPNPFNEFTYIEFNLAKAENIKLAVYNSSGNLVKVLEEGFFEPGNYTVQWNATDNKHNRVAQGVYIYRLVTSSEIKTGKALLMK